VILFGKTRPMVSFLTAKCPSCGSTALVRTWTVVESRYDGKREEAVPVGGHYVCDDCNAHCRVTAHGVTRVGLQQGATSSAPPATPSTSSAPRKPEPIPVRFPR
jgi:hypothetical protein